MVLLYIDHVQLAMPAGGESTAADFYCGLLGLTQVPKPPALAVRGGCWFENETVKLHLGVDADFRPALKAHPALMVSDLDELTAVLGAAGVTITPGEPLEGVKRVHVADPFGNRIELIETL